MNANEIRINLENHYDKLGYGSKKTLKSYLEELEQSKYINIDLPIPDEVNGPCQVLEPFNDGYLLRIFHIITLWDREEERPRTKLLEEFRCFFSKTYGDKELFIKYEYGRSGVYGYRVPRKMMGYHQYDLAYKTPLKFINKTELFPYIDFSDIKILGMQLMDEFYAADQRQYHNDISRVNAVDREYTLELLLKSGKTKLAEIYVNECWTADMRKVLRYNAKLLERPNASRVRLASSLGTTKYQTGMIQFSYPLYQQPAAAILEVLELCSWNKFHKYIKKQYVYKQHTQKSNYLVDYLDYRKKNRELGLPDFPDNLYEAKEVVREQLDKKKREDDNKKYNPRIQKRIKDLFKIDFKDFIVFPAPSLNALYDEGKEMHHCVAQYAEKYASGKTDIYFLRTKENPDQPLVTIEVKNGKLAQARGKHNEQPPKETLPVINKLVSKYSEVSCML